MSIFIAWWFWPLAAFIGGIFGALFLTPRSQGYMDYGPALVCLAWLGGGTLLALGLVLGTIVGGAK